MSLNLLGDLSSSQDKVAIADAFSKAAATYDHHAAFQRDVGHRLLDKMPRDLSNKIVLDLGCGTGYFSEQLLLRGATVICIDLSPQMLNETRKRCGDKQCHYYLADAESLPLGNDAVDYVFSSLALQWCENLAWPLSEMRRVTKAGGELFFSTLLDGSLIELKKAWAKIDSHQHVNDFVSVNQVKIALAQSHCPVHHLDLPTIVVWYDSAFSLMRDLKGIGANHVAGRSHGLTRRRTILDVERYYQAHRNIHRGLLPATYQVCLGTINL